MTEFSKISDQDLLAQLTTPRTARLTLTAYRQLTRVAQASLEELKQLYRVDHAIRIKTALELGLRMQREVLPPRPVLDTPQKIADFLRPECRGLCEEHFWVISLNARMELVACEDIAKGALNTVTPAMREIFRSAVVHRACSIVVAHNHPSGRPDPSDADLATTRRLVRAGLTMNIPVNDHIVIGLPTLDQPKDFVSLRELGMMMGN